jgi:hypothetical protein
MSANLAQRNPMTGRPPRALDLERVRDLMARMSVIEAARALGVHRNTLYYHLQHSARIAARKAAVESKRTALLKAKRRRDAASASRRERLQSGRAYRDNHGGLLLLVCLIHADKLARACSRCEIEKPLSEFYFKREVGDFRTICIDCCRARQLSIWHERGKFNRVRRSRASTRLSEFYPYRVSAEADGAELVEAINRAVPRSLPEDLRADVCQQLALAVLAGDVDLEGIGEHVRLYTKRQRAFMPNRYLHRLDDTLTADSNQTLLDTLTTEDTLGRWLGGAR